MVQEFSGVFFVKALKDGRALASIGNFLELVKLGLYPNYLFLNRRLEWRSLDPTLDISSPFVKKHFTSFF